MLSELFACPSQFPVCSDASIEDRSTGTILKGSWRADRYGPEVGVVQRAAK